MGQLEQGNMYNNYNFMLGAEGPEAPLPLGYYANTTVTSTKVSVFQCPSDRSLTFQITPQYAGGALSGPISTKGNYAVSWGNTYWGQDQPATTSPPGGFPLIDPRTGTTPTFMKSAFGHYNVSFAAVTDGLSNTAFLAEVLQGEMFDVRGLVWSSIPGGGSFFSRMPPNNPRDFYGFPAPGDELNQTIFCVSEPGMGLPCTGGIGDKGAFAGSRSRHPGGVNVLFGDGSVHFVKNTISEATWLALNTMGGGEVISSDSY
jgi:prepilin-type processing-associated H-X9-DG protein